jgi:hypothetical protein
MRNINPLSVLLRVCDPLPDDVKVIQEEFREGWSFMGSGNAVRLNKEIQESGWQFVKTSDAFVGNGVGETSEFATANALRLALRRAGTLSNVVGVERIALTQYPWFHLASVMVHPYRIQHVALPVAEEAMPLRIDSPRIRLARRPVALDPQFASAMPMLKQMLVASKGLERDSL